VPGGAVSSLVPNVLRVNCGERASLQRFSLLAVCWTRLLGDEPSGNTVAGWMAVGRQPTPLRIATSIELNRRTVLATVTIHNPRFNRNIGIPISNIEPKNNMR
jgi:hypothetical protein